MSTYLEVSDGTGRELFPIQREFLAWLQEQPGKVIAAQLPPGTGKSLIVRTIQRATGGVVITPSNLLVDQYSSTYPTVNAFKGATRYHCKSHDMSCAEVKALNMPPCKNCTYRDCRRAALEGVPTFFNPMSLYSLTQTGKFERPSVTIIDEAHQLLSMLSMVAGMTFPASKFRLPDSNHASEVLEWLHAQGRKLNELVTRYSKAGAEPKALTALRDWQRIQTVAQCLSEAPTNYVIARVTDRRTNVEALLVSPVNPPKSLLDQVLGTGRRILLSGTLSQLDAQLLAPGEIITYKASPSPIPAAQRQVLYRPRIYGTDAQLWGHVRELHDEFGGPTLVHVTYELNRRLEQLTGGMALHNTAENKDTMVARFKEQGGVFFASGCAEGLDLPDGQCRLNIVPILPRPNIGDPVVKKWLALPGGNKRYDLETLRTVQQQIGRSTRHSHDRSVAVVGDPRFSQLVGRNRGDISDCFYSSISWTGKLKGAM